MVLTNSPEKCHQQTPLKLGKGRSESSQLGRSPTVLAVRLVVVLGVSERQHRIGAAGQAGTPLRRLAQISVAPKPPAALRRHRGLAVAVELLGHADREAAVGRAQVRAEGEAALRRWLVHPEVTQAEVLAWNTTTF